MGMCINFNLVFLSVVGRVSIWFYVFECERKNSFGVKPFFFRMMRLFAAK